MTTWFTQFIELKTEEEKNEFRKNITKIGYSAINQWLHSFNDMLKKMSENEFKQVESWLELGKEILPDLSSISPAWENKWKELFDLYQAKTEIYNQIPVEERAGNWQVLFDNPNTTDGIVCQPNIAFSEATYLYAKYQLGLKKAEVLQLQKVTISITRNG